jgi:hypothetical protein
MFSLGCAASGSHVDGPPPPPAAASTAADAQRDSGAAVSSSAASAAQPVAKAPAPPERPFAKTPLEAQSLIQGQIDARSKVLWKCVDAYRAQKGDPHKPVIADIGIDQEGNLIGVTAPNAKQGGDLDPALRSCLTDGLRGLAFPRSHAGVITVRQTFKDTQVPQ